VPRPEPVALGVVLVAATVASAVAPKSYLTWLLEAAPVLIAVPLLALTYPRFRWTRLAYWLMFLHGLVLVLGAPYTYAEVPLGLWLRDAFDLARSPYDRIGHFAQGFVPAIVVRELLVRRTPLRAGGWLTAVTVLSCLGISAVWELLEWAGAVATGESAEVFLGMQGDEWDTQWDMLLALIGALLALALLSRLHDRQLASRP
jgi:putative membrane protein